MAWTKTFRVHPQFGIPDKDIREWLSMLEKEAYLSVNTTYIPPIGGADARITVIVTKLDELSADAVKFRDRSEQLAG